MSEYTAGQVEEIADWCMANSSGVYRNSAIAAHMLLAYAATMRQQPTNPPEIGSKLVGDGAVSDEVVEHVQYSLDNHEDNRGYAEQVSARSVREALEAVWPAAVAPLLRAPAEQGGRVDALKNLPSMWRKIEQSSETQTDFDKGYEQASYECADALEAALAQNTQGEPHYWLDEATMYGSKRKEFVRQIPLYLHAERARVPESKEEVAALLQQACCLMDVINAELKSLHARAAAPSQPAAEEVER